MRPLLILFCLTLFPIAALAGGEAKGPAVPDYPTDKVADNVWVIHGPLTVPNPDNQGFMNNPGIILTDAGVVIHDPGGSVQSGEMVLRAVARLTDKPVVAVFNSHIHGDHWLGNQAIRAAYPGVAIYAHPNLLALIEEGEGESWVRLMEQLTEGKTIGTMLVGPNKPVDHGDEIRIGDTTFVIHHYGQAHTTTDIMVEIKERDIVFLGDNVINGRVPRINEGNVMGIIKTCEEILKTGASVYVPGHGKTGDKSVVDTMHTYFSAVYTTVKKLYAEGLSDFEMKDQVSTAVKDYAGWLGFEAQLGKHISFTYLQIEAAEF